jgi:hypothetical protein
MGKIIPFRRPGRPQKPDLISTQQLVIRSLFDGIQGLEGVGIELDPSLRIQEFLDSRRGYVSNQSIAVGEASLRGLSHNELVAIAKNSTETDWAAKPGYYTALVDAIKSR